MSQFLWNPSPFQWNPVPFWWNPAESGGIEAFLQESVGHWEVQPWPTEAPWCFCFCLPIHLLLCDWTGRQVYHPKARWIQPWCPCIEGWGLPWPVQGQAAGYGPVYPLHQDRSPRRRHLLGQAGWAHQPTCGPSTSSRDKHTPGWCPPLCLPSQVRAQAPHQVQVHLRVSKGHSHSRTGALARSWNLNWIHPQISPAGHPFWHHEGEGVLVQRCLHPVPQEIHADPCPIYTGSPYSAQCLYVFDDASCAVTSGKRSLSWIVESETHSPRQDSFFPWVAQLVLDTPLRKTSFWSESASCFHLIACHVPQTFT